MTRIFECGVLMRCLVLVIALLYSFTAITQDESLIYLVAHADRFAMASMWGMGVFAVAGFIDLVINDLMPDDVTFSRGLADRHKLYMAITGCFAVQIWTDVLYRLPDAILPFYVVYAVFVPLAAFADVRKRYKKKATQ